MKIVVYNDSYKYQVSNLLYKYMLEMEHNCIGSTDEAIDMMIANGRHIYLLLDDKDIVIGFTIFYINNQYGLLPPTIVNEYVYLLPPYRTSVATKYLLLQMLEYCDYFNYDLYGYTYKESSNIKNSKVVDSIEVGTIYRVPIDNMKKKLKRLRRK
jgi:hypothetical protein